MSATRTINLRVHFQDRAEAASCLRGLRQIPGSSLNVVRGRVTPDEADYDIQLRGQGRLMEQAVWTLWKVTTLPTCAVAELREASPH